MENVALHNYLLYNEILRGMGIYGYNRDRFEPVIIFNSTSTIL